MSALLNDNYKGPSRIQIDTAAAMVSNFLNTNYKLNNEGVLAPQNPSTNSISTWFSKEAIDELFTDNGYTPGSEGYGLRIYFGAHGNSDAEKRDMPNRLDYYANQNTAILVCTKDGNDQLFADSATIGAGNALDEGGICPPPIICKGSAIQPVLNQ